MVPATITAITVHIRFAQRFLITSYIAYERLIRMHFGELGDMPIGRITNLMVQNHITKLSRLVDENGLSENYLTRLRTFMHMVFEYLQPIKLDHVPKNSKKRLLTVRLAVFPLAPLVGLEPRHAD